TPARDLFKNERYCLPHNGKRFTLVNVARGCPYPCIFCIANVYYGKALRKHSVSYLMNEIKECVERYDIDHFLFWEEVFTLDKEFAFEMCDAIIKSGLKISWATTTRADLLTRELLEKMKEANCEMLGLGVESISQEVLDNVKKNCTVADIERGVKLCNEVGIRTMGHFIYGLPGETYETALHTMKFAKKLNLDYIQTYCAVPYPKTELGELARKNNWVRSDRWADYDLLKSIMATDTLTPEEVNKLRDRSLRTFYFRPSVAYKQLKVITSFRHIFKALNFLDWIYVGRGRRKG
ncbi:MAG: B12-binding domain-containing radical SAM protein, partial [Thermodesulfobacteriota bacterium]